MKFLVQGDPPYLSAAGGPGSFLSWGLFLRQDLVAPASPRGVLPGWTRVPGHMGGYEHALRVLPISREHESRKSSDHVSSRRPCGNASASTSRSFVCKAPCRPPGLPCESVGPPGGGGVAGARPCTVTWEPEVTVSPKSRLSHQHVGYSGSELQAPCLPLLS